ncbi:MAG TPA: MIP/aquaporin family protein [Tepidisphaeraceae bacterium]|jgi:glycerol uptake facilitator protein|nr:MIP/aquaporin family protein [Tepidisphaeraceae bacterium]
MNLQHFIAEFVGTAILILLGNGVVANVALRRTLGGGAGWIVITLGWGMAVFVAVMCVAKFSGAHLNPAVTVAMAFNNQGGFTWGDAPTYIVAQLLGAFVGAVLVFLYYGDHFEATDDANTKFGCFSTAPAIRNLPRAFFCEVVGTFLLVFPIFLMVAPTFALPGAGTEGQEIANGFGALGALPVGLLVFAIGMSLGGTTGYAINPARDLGPRIAHALLPIRGKRDSDWGYAWIPVVAPLTGALLAALAARGLV